MRKRSSRLRFGAAVSGVAISAMVSTLLWIPGAPSGAGAASAAGNPPANITPNPTVFRPQTLHNYLLALNAARADEGVGPMALPSNWRALTIPQQIFVTVDLERVARGLPPFIGTSPLLQATAAKGAATSTDPGNVSVPASQDAANWEAGLDNPLGADYLWMYYDGPGFNLDCPPTGGGTCWVHRENILSMGTCTTCIMGTGNNPAANSMTELFVRPINPVALTFTWANNVAPYLTNPITVTNATTCSGPKGSGPAPSGYDLVGRDGGVFVFSPPGTCGGFYGSLPADSVRVNNIVGMVSTSNHQGYFLVGSDGGVFSFGNAPFLGSLPGLKVTPSLPISGIVPTGTDGGYFLVGSDGGVFSFGNAPFLGSLPGEGINVNNIIGIASTPSGNGYWLVSATGTVYAFGAAKQLGSATGTSSPVSAIAGTPDGGGYWIVTRNGTVRAFGDAPDLGTLPTSGVAPAMPVIGIVRTSDTRGYWLIGADGGVFTFGDAPYVGSLPALTVRVSDVVGAVPTSA
jgi:hypothetical protein